MLRIDNSLLQEIGLGSLPDQEKNSLLKHIYETLEMRVGIRLADQMSNEQLDEFEKYFEAKDDAGAFKWLESNFPNYKDIVQEEFDKLKAEVAQSAPQILSTSPGVLNGQPTQSQPPQAAQAAPTQQMAQSPAQQQQSQPTQPQAPAFNPASAPAYQQPQQAPAAQPQYQQAPSQPAQPQQAPQFNAPQVPTQQQAQSANNGFQSSSPSQQVSPAPQFQPQQAPQTASQQQPQQFQPPFPTQQPPAGPGV
jgi:hypothetical protein